MAFAYSIINAHKMSLNLRKILQKTNRDEGVLNLCPQRRNIFAISEYKNWQETLPN